MIPQHQSQVAIKLRIGPSSGRRLYAARTKCNGNHITPTSGLGRLPLRDQAASRDSCIHRPPPAGTCACFLGKGAAGGMTAYHVSPSTADATRVPMHTLRLETLRRPTEPPRHDALPPATRDNRAQVYHTAAKHPDQTLQPVENTIDALPTRTQPPPPPRRQVAGPPTPRVPSQADERPVRDFFSPSGPLSSPKIEHRS